MGELSFDKPVSTITLSHLLREVLGSRKYTVKEDGLKTVVYIEGEFTEEETAAITEIVRSLNRFVGTQKPNNRSPLDKDAPEQMLPFRVF